MIGTRFYKGQLSNEDYVSAATWCSETQLATIDDMGDYYEVVALPQPSLDDIKEEKIAELKHARDIEEVADIEVNGHVFDYDENARERINAAIIALELTQGTITWTLADNTDTDVTAQDLKYVIAMVAQRSNSLHIKYRKLKEQVLSAQTAEQVDRIIW